MGDLRFFRFKILNYQLETEMKGEAAHETVGIGLNKTTEEILHY